MDPQLATTEARREQAKRRDQRRTKSAGPKAAKLVASTPTPSQEVADRELLAEAVRRLSAEERQLVELRRQGHSWDEIAALVGDTSVALRKRLSRALDRITRELGLAESAHE